MTKVWETSHQKGSALLLLLAIADFADDAGKAFPSVDTLASKIRMSPRACRYLLDKLVTSKELSVERNAGPRGCNLFRVQTLQGEIFAGVQETAGGLQQLLPAGGAIAIAPEPSLNHQRTVITAATAEKPRPTACVVGFDFGKGQFTAITGVDHERWGNAYPAIDVPREIAAAAAWLVANPKNRKSNYQRYLVNWFGRAQDRAPRAVGGVLPATEKPWWLTAPGIEAKGAELAVNRGDDAFPHFKARVFEAAGAGPWNESQTAARVVGEAHRRAAA